MRNPERQFEPGLEITSEQKEESVKSEKEIAWENKLREIDETRDLLGEKIDDGVKETVAALNLNKLPTSASCEGHVDRGTAAPWIEISAPNEPEERFVGENDVFKRVAEKYGVSFEDVRRAKNEKAWAEAIVESSSPDETSGYKQWREENKKLMKKADGFLRDFYKERKVESTVKLITDEGGEGEFRIHNGGKDYNLDLENLTAKQKEKLKQKLPKYQEEMNDFGKFLKEKYFQTDY